MSDDVIQLISKDALIIRLQVLKVSFWLLGSLKFQVGKTYGKSIWPPPLGRSRVKFELRLGYPKFNVIKVTMLAKC